MINCKRHGKTLPWHILNYYLEFPGASETKYIQTSVNAADLGAANQTRDFHNKKQELQPLVREVRLRV
jgi:hypothetical protein